MRKERIKTVILVLLIINCIQLTGQIWLDKKLWPSGYNFFNSMSNIPVIGNVVKLFPFGNPAKGSEELFEIAAMPKRIVVNGGSAREVYNNGEASFNDALSYTKPIIKSLISSPVKYTTISAEQWHSMIKGKSIYIDFGFSVDPTELFNIFKLQGSQSFTQFSQTKSIIIAPDTVTNEVIICVLDDKSGNAVKYSVETRGDELQKHIESLTYGKQLEHAFAFEMNLDSSSRSNVPVDLDPLVLFPMNQPQKKSITVQSSFVDNNNLTQIADRIVNAFGYTPSSLRRKVTQSGVVIYVENNATVSINPNGLIEYKAVSANKGIMISTTNLTAKQAVIETLNIVQKVWKFSGVTPYNDIRLQSDLSDNKNGNYIVKLNYYANGTPVMLNYNKAAKSSICAEIENGHIKSFWVALETIKINDKPVTWTPVLEAVDQLFEQSSVETEEKKIDDIFECYAVNGKEALPKWYVKVDDDSGSVIVP